VPALNARPTYLKLLPCPIDRKLPTVQVVFGENFDDEKKLVYIHGTVDTGAALTIGSLTFFAYICKLFPWIVEEIIVAKPGGYSETLLSGMVSSDSEGVTMASLPVLFKLKMSYFTADGERTYLKVACGKHVSCNFLLGAPFLKGTKAKLDYGLDVVECAGLTAPGNVFKMDYRIPKLISDSGLPSSP